MKVSIVGSGYVGLVSGACLADRGHEVVCIDADAAKVAAIERGEAPFYEPGLPELLAHVAGRRLRATTDLASAVRDSDLTLIAVGTPFDGATIDLSQVLGATDEIGRALRAKSVRHTVVVKSTVVPGTTAKVVLPALEHASGRKAGQDLGVGVNPEFLTEGEAVSDFLYPDRIVLGGNDALTLAALDELYASFAGVPFIRTTPSTAELIKYASNALLATMISFSNELANLATALGDIDIADVMRGVHASRYLTLEDGASGLAPISSFLWAGCGFGGSCLPKDVAALRAHGEAAGVPMRMLDAVLRVNEAQPARLVALLTKHFPKLAGVRVAVLGLSFRPDTDDIRHSPALPLCRELAERGADVRAYDPKANEPARRALAGTPVRFADSLEAVLADVDAAVLVTRWSEFERAPALLRGRSPAVVFVDGRRMIDPDAVEIYEGIGR
jgi:UDPglucose 6-dehydrogenase/GDP-mannose 6-dehydrogenase